MLTPGDIRNKSFEKVRGGYRVEDVQPFLNELASQIEALHGEKADLQKKLEILAEKIEQYREDEDSLRSALIGAQKLGDSVVRDAKRKAESIIAQATRKSEEMLSDAQASINREASALNKMQVEVAKFKAQILNMYKRHIELIQEIPYEESDIESLEGGQGIQFVSGGREEEAQPKVDEPRPLLDNKIELNFSSQEEDSEESGALSFEEADAEKESESVETDLFPRKKTGSKFGKLRFGADYDLTRRE